MFDGDVFRYALFFNPSLRNDLLSWRWKDDVQAKLK